MIVGLAQGSLKLPSSNNPVMIITRLSPGVKEAVLEAPHTPPSRPAGHIPPRYRQGPEKTGSAMMASVNDDADLAAPWRTWISQGAPGWSGMSLRGDARGGQNGGPKRRPWAGRGRCTPALAPAVKPCAVERHGEGRQVQGAGRRDQVGQDEGNRDSSSVLRSLAATGCQREHDQRDYPLASHSVLLAVQIKRSIRSRAI